MLDTTGVTALALAPTGSDDLVAQLNAASRRPLIWPWLAVAVVVLAGATTSLHVVSLMVLILGALGTAWLGLHERAKRTVVAFYDVTGPTADWFDALVEGWNSLARLGGAWRIASSGAITTTYQHKVNSGAGALVRREPVQFAIAPPKTLTTNVAVPTIQDRRNSLLFLPDRVLVKTGKVWSDIDYRALRVTARPTQFIEAAGVPRDGRQIDTTWQYVNVRGGADRRFKNNRQLPVMLYGRIAITSATGLRWEIDCSRVEASDWARNIFAART